MSDHTAFVAPAGFEDVLRAELARAGVPVLAAHGRLIVTEATRFRPAWAQTIWHDPRELRAPSIKKAAANLRALRRSWWLLPTELHRRAQLIADHLPHVSAKPLSFGDPPPSAPLGGWTLLAPDRILAAPATGSPFPNGEPRFVEDREGPPNRAYLKLWEAFTVLGTQPAPGEICLDLGAAPGGWSWVLARLGARVTAVDKAPLAAEVAGMPGVSTIRDSAFGVRPQHVGRVDWVFSDIACEPAKLYELVRRWLDGGYARNLVCTLKFQGETDFGAQDAFAAIPGSRLMHLHHNKHELTWVNLEADRAVAA